MTLSYINVDNKKDAPNTQTPAAAAQLRRLLTAGVWPPVSSYAGARH